MPSRGEKSTLVEHALANAREALGRKLAESSSQARLLEGIAERFGLPRAPRRIEVFDNSHIAGTNAVGGMIVAGPKASSKASIGNSTSSRRTSTPGDDYAMMREVLTRRFKRIADAEVLGRDRNRSRRNRSGRGGRTVGARRRRRRRYRRGSCVSGPAGSRSDRRRPRASFPSRAKCWPDSGCTTSR